MACALRTVSTPIVRQYHMSHKVHPEVVFAMDESHQPPIYWEHSHEPGSCMTHACILEMGMLRSYTH